MINLKKTKLNGCFLVELPFYEDQRGNFKKIFQGTKFKNLGINFDCTEEYVTTSKMNVIRGMHFQLPPHDHEKIVYCLAGRVKDVILDIRIGSETYGQFEVFELDEKTPIAIYIPKGFAHGFASLDNNSIMMYRVSSEHDVKSDHGIRWSSFGCDWGIFNPIVSKRDDEHKNFQDFESPFRK